MDNGLGLEWAAFLLAFGWRLLDEAVAKFLFLLGTVAERMMQRQNRAS